MSGRAADPVQVPPGPAAEPGYASGMAWRPRAGEAVCGDVGVVWRLEAGGLLLALADGLGHGQAARDAALAALVTLRRRGGTGPLPALMQACDGALRGMRGAALALVRLDAAKRTLEHVGVGNIGVLVQLEKRRRLPATPGIVGAGLPPLQVERLALPRCGVLALFSDGIDPLFDRHETWAGQDLEEPMALERRAQALVSRWGRPDDDAILLMAGWRGPDPA